ncbi:hypothetical protein [Sporomusa sp. KB1]|jgi:hypothetical protein|uniref:hypothetical protein n=1 Tax=Sporomusa sp. KB1 TaxID=943346 RepID=UPI001C9619C6|nr:hypothetical protein [Sporomusa sp. KB1]
MNVRPGVWYYNSETVNFVVPQEYVVVSQDQVWYAGDFVESEEFVLFTEEAYSANESEDAE